LGTPQELTDWEGQIVWSARYKVYGNVVRKDVEQVENNLRFQGQYWDEETGLHYNRHRYYDPNTGQFTQQDPIGLLGGINNYGYAPNPTGWIDPFGLVCKERYDRYKKLREDGYSARDAATFLKNSAAGESASYQGKDPYFGVDKLENISLQQGDKVAHITFKSDGDIAGSYFTTPEALETSRRVDGAVDAKRLNQGLQVYAGDRRTEYKRYVQVFEVTEEIPYGGVATGPTRANPQFNPGRYKLHQQYFITDDNLSKLKPVPGTLEEMTNLSAPDISAKLDKLRNKP